MWGGIGFTEMRVVLIWPLFAISAAAPCFEKRKTSDILRSVNKAGDQEYTTRQKIIHAIEGRSLTARDISKEVGIREKEVLEHLPHIARSMGASRAGAKFVVEPSICLECGFVFRKRERLKTPGKCPVCRSEEISETKYEIRK